MKNRLSTLFLHLSIFLILAFGYEYYIAPLYGYQGYIYEPNDFNWYVALILTVMLSLVTPISSKRASTLFYQLIVSMVLLPMLVLFYAEDRPWQYMAQVIAAYLVALVVPVYIKVHPPKFRFVSKRNLQRFFFFASAGYIAAVFLMGGGAFLNFDLSKVYDFRDDAANNLPEVFGYITPLVGKVIVPIAFVLSLLYKQYLWGGVFLLFSFLIFGLTAHKAPLFYPFFVLFIYIICSRKNLPVKFNAGIVVVLLIALVDFWYAENYETEYARWTGALFMERSFFLPAEINYLYYDFFSKNEMVWFADSKLSMGLMQYPYPLDPPHLIGRKYFNSDTTGANTGWFGSGYMQAGFFGLILYGAIIGWVFKYIDVCARNSGNLPLITAAVATPVYILLVASDLPTTFFTHGLYLNLLLIACFHEGKQPQTSPRPQRQTTLVLNRPRNHLT